MKFYSIYLFLIVFLFTGCSLFVDRPNVIVIMCDQLNPQAMGWTGNAEVITPNLDHFSESAYCFTNAYCASPMSDPAIHSIFTGLYPSKHWVIKDHLKMKENMPLLTSILNNDYYTTACVGEITSSSLCENDACQCALSWGFKTSLGGSSAYFSFLESELRNRNLDSIMYTDQTTGNKLPCRPGGIAFLNQLPEELTPERWITNEALKFLDHQNENDSNNPFFLNLSYSSLFQSYSPVKKYADMYLDKIERLQLPPDFSLEELQRWCNKNAGFPDSLTIEDVQYLRAMYFGCVSQLDAALGGLFHGIEERGLMENTIIVFTSKQGDNLGEHGRFHSGNMFDASVRVPLMIWYPKTNLRERKKIDANVSHVDLFSTILTAVGISHSEFVQGRDLLPLMKGKEDWTSRSVYAEYFKYGVNPSQLMLRKGNYKLTYSIENEDGMFEIKLYNVKEDPYELNDLSESSDHGVVLMEMSHELMDDYWKEIVDGIPTDLLN